MKPIGRFLLKKAISFTDRGFYRQKLHRGPVAYSRKEGVQINREYTEKRKPLIGLAFPFVTKHGIQVIVVTLQSG